MSARRPGPPSIPPSAGPPSGSCGGSESPPRTGPGNAATAREVEHAINEEVREAGLTGLFRHMNDKATCDRLDKLWAQAIAHAGLPPMIIENEYVRDAILQTSLANAAYTVPHVDVFTRRLLPAEDQVIP